MLDFYAECLISARESDAVQGRTTLMVALDVRGADFQFRGAIAQVLWVAGESCGVRLQKKGAGF